MVKRGGLLNSGNDENDPSLSNMDSVQMGDLAERLDLLTEENSLISEQNAILTKELTKAHGDIYQREENIIQLTRGLEDAAGSMKSMETEIERLARERKEAEEEIVDKNSRIGEMEESVKGGRAAVKEATSVKNQLLVQLSDMREEREQRETECDELSGKVSTSLSRINDISARLGVKTMEADALGEKLRRTTAELTTTRNDAEGMMTVLNGMEKVRFYRIVSSPGTLRTPRRGHHTV